MTEMPLVTVFMPVYNGERYLHKAIDSILKQTYTAFEFLIINDGSIDKSVNIIQSYNDPRIRLVHNEGNLKLITTLNKGLELARGKYIARMDCDDISLPERLKEQVEFMEKNEHIGICGTWVKTLVSGLSLNVRYPTGPEEIKAQMLFRIAIAHPTVMMRASFIKQYKLQYRSTYLHAEDYELWNRCILLFPLANVPKVLLKYRINRNGISQKQRDTQNQTVKQIYKDNFERLGIDYKEEYGQIHFLVGVPKYPQNKNFSKQAERWLLQIYEANKTAQCYDNDILSRIIGERWLAACAITKTGLFNAWRIFSDSPINRFCSFTYSQKIKLVLFHLIRQSGLGNQFIQLMRI
jgi:glycosyltransferase involved in cell wall biosynthesis